MGKHFKKLTVRLVALLVAVVAVLTTLNVTPVPVSAAGGCAENWQTPLDLVAAGNYVEAAAGSVDMNGTKVRLLYSAGSGCMWGKIQDIPAGLATGRHHGEVWVERSNNGGATAERVGRTYNNAVYSSVYTPAFNTIGYNAVRVCGATAYTNIWSSNPYNTMESIGSGCSKWFWPGVLWPGMYMGHKGFECLNSQNNRYAFCQQYDGNLVLYSWGRAVWATNTFRTASKLVMQHDGNLVIYDYYNRAVWATGTNRYSGTYLAMQNDGNAVLYAAGRAVWATNTSGR